MKKKVKKTDAINAEGKRIIYAPAPLTKGNGKRGMPSLQAVGGKPSSQRCPRCGHKTELGKLASHQCPELTTKVRVRKVLVPSPKAKLRQSKISVPAKAFR
jgi:hypothetical protein